LGTLDPHSSFFDPKEYAQMRERQEGRYYGLGITINILDGYIAAFSVFEGSPAYRQGIRRGDLIWKIEGEETKGWTTIQAQNRLRGPKGTSVNIEIKRRGYADPIPLQVTRDEVYLPTVPAYFMIDATTGYIRHKDWGENTDRDIRRALNDLSKQGMKRLIYDIRTNPGGPLDQAIKVTNEFLPRGKMIVYTKGRIANSDQDYRATEESEFTDIPLVVITNRSSASASEIFAGALQDHDRAIIVGETTFGKALVQSVYRISGGAGLALTTAHYYTPSGRLIQRPWDETFDEYLAYTQREPDASRQHSASDLKRTAAGRPVYSGGGVEPDKYLAGLPSPQDGIGFSPTAYGRMLFTTRGAFENYAVKYMATKDTRVSQKATGRVEVARNFVVTDAMVEDFKAYLRSEKIPVDEDAFKKDAAFIRAMIRYRIDEAVFGIADALKHLVEVDPQAQLALTQFGEAQKLLLMNRSSGRAAQ
jgi:carboxyl-terminal processing protease